MTGQTGYPQPEDTYLEVTYDLSDACPTCEIGKSQKAPFRFRSEPKSKRSQFIGLNWVFDEVFVRTEVTEVLKKEGIQGLRFSRPVKNGTGAELESIYQMHVDTILCDSLGTSTLRFETCEMPRDESMVRFLKANGSQLMDGPFCGKCKFNYPRKNEEEILLPESVRQVVVDVVRSSEWFGSGGSAGRPIFVSEAFKSLYDKMKWRGLSFHNTKIDEKVQQGA